MVDSGYPPPLNVFSLIIRPSAQHRTSFARAASKICLRITGETRPPDARARWPVQLARGSAARRPCQAESGKRKTSVTSHTHVPARRASPRAGCSCGLAHWPNHALRRDYDSGQTRPEGKLHGDPQSLSEGDVVRACGRVLLRLEVVERHAEPAEDVVACGRERG